MSGRILSPAPCERRVLRENVERSWHERLLEFARRSAIRELRPHFRERMVERSITQRQVESLVDEGCIWAIDVGSGQDHPDWAPKWILSWPNRQQWAIRGVFAYDGERLIGITVYRNNRAESLPVLRRTARINLANSQL